MSFSLEVAFSQAIELGRKQLRSGEVETVDLSPRAIPGIRQDAGTCWTQAQEGLLLRTLRRLLGVTQHEVLNRPLDSTGRACIPTPAGDVVLIRQRATSSTGDHMAYYLARA